MICTEPDWSTQTEEIHCPLCNYNLRGLTEPRCPECGYQFDWRDLTDPTRKVHPYLFEHHPERNVRSFLRTALGQWLPWRFWRSLRPEMPANRRRLLIYWWTLAITAVGVVLLTMSLTVIERLANRPGNIASLRRYYLAPAQAQELADLVKNHGSLEAYIQKSQPSPTQGEFWSLIFREWRFEFLHRTKGMAVALVLIFCVWPWLSLLVMNVFRVSMHRAHLRPEHFMRVLLYSSGVMVAPLIIHFGYELLFDYPRLGRRLGLDWLEYRGMWQIAMIAAIVASLLVLILRLIVAMRVYLRFKHAIATVLTTQLIVMLLITVIVIDFPGVFAFLSRVWLTG